MTPAQHQPPVPANSQLARLAWDRSSSLLSGAASALSRAASSCGRCRSSSKPSTPSDIQASTCKGNTTGQQRQPCSGAADVHKTSTAQAEVPRQRHGRGRGLCWQGAVGCHFGLHLPMPWHHPADVPSSTSPRAHHFPHLRPLVAGAAQHPGRHGIDGRCAGARDAVLQQVAIPCRSLIRQRLVHLCRQHPVSQSGAPF